MAVGQSVLSGSWDVPALRAAEDRLQARAVDAGRVYAALLRDVLVVHGQYCAAGMPLSSQPQVALLLRCSELRAGKLLNDALGLAELPEALSALEWGLLTVEQSSVVVAQLAVLSPPERLRVWDRLLVRLRGDVEQGAVLPPARLAELLRGWVMQADQDAARERREQAERDRRVEYRRRDDGLADVLLFGVAAPLAQAVLPADPGRVGAGGPVGRPDGRSAPAGHGGGPAARPCGWPLRGVVGGRRRTVRVPAPDAGGVRGAEVAVLVPLPTALGQGEVPAELVGHGPIDHGLPQDLLASAPRLRPVFVDEHGVVVAVGDQVLVPERGDPASLGRTLLQLSEMTPDRVHPRHPYDHPPDADHARDVGLARDVGPPVDDVPRLIPDDGAAAVGPPGDAGRTAEGSGTQAVWPGQARPQDDAVVLARAALGYALPSSGAHPEGRPGGYRVPRRLRRLIELRAPRCEFPGCGARAVRCDAEGSVSRSV